ncbi:MAG: MarR family transcriptional regulator [Pseudomonadota bacterium]
MTWIDPLDCPYYLVSRTALLMSARFKRILVEAGFRQVKPAYLWALLSLWRSDGLKVVDLARETTLETSTMTGLLDRMERDGLVIRTPDADDRRTLRIHLTEEGKKLQDPVIDLAQSMMDEFLMGIPEEDVSSVIDVLRRILQSAAE